MHFSISETEECKDESGSYTLYKISVNGAHHCSVRFSQINNLYEQLKKEFGTIPSFPPKKIFSLSLKEKEERRYQLEKFLQQISQVQKVINSDLFVNFFLNAQKETQAESDEIVEVSVHLPNSEKITVCLKSFDQTEDLLEKVMRKLNLNPNFDHYFGIYLIKKDENDSVEIVRKLQDFESPYISLKAANKLQKHRLLLRKSIFEPSFEEDLHADNVAVNLLYIQAISDLEKDWISPTDEALKQLQQLEQQNSKKEYLKLMRTQKYYGYLHFKKCIVDYPEKNTNILLAIGNKTVNFRVLNSKIETESNFKVTRIRCWKISGINSVDANGKAVSHLELSFEYLFSKKNLEWITIISDQAILISMTLQSMVDEILLLKDGKTIRKITDRHNFKSITFMTRQKSLISTKENSENSNLKDYSSQRNYNQNSVFEDDTIISNDDL